MKKPKKFWWLLCDIPKAAFNLPEGNESPPAFCLGVVLLAGGQENGACCTGHGQHTDDGKQHGAVITGFGQIKSTGIDHAQRCQGVYGAVFGEHIHIVAVNGCGGGEELVGQLLLGHVVENVGQVAIGLHVALLDGFLDDGLGVAGIVLDQACHVGAVDIAEDFGFHLGNDHFDIFLQQGVAVIGTDFGDGVCIILKALDDDLAGLAVGIYGDEVGGVSFGFHVIDHIINAFVLVQLSLDEVVVSIVVNDELHVFKVALAVGEQLGQIDAVGV